MMQYFQFSCCIVVFLYLIASVVVVVTYEIERRRSLSVSLPHHKGVLNEHGEFYLNLLDEIAKKCHFKLWGCVGPNSRGLWERPKGLYWQYVVAMYDKRLDYAVAFYIKEEGLGFSVYLNGHDFLRQVGIYDLFNPNHNQDSISNDILMSIERVENENLECGNGHNLWSHGWLCWPAERVSSCYRTISQFGGEIFYWFQA